MGYDAEAKSFWDDFFNVFGISRRRVATFEKKVKKIDDKPGFIDLLWKGVIVIEHKSRGRDLIKAYNQAKDFFLVSLRISERAFVGVERGNVRLLHQQKLLSLAPILELELTKR